MRDGTSGVEPPPPVERGFVRTSRGRLHYRACGEGRTFVLLQLLPFGSAMFEPAMPAWARRGLRCLAFDLMGYGASDLRSGAWNVTEHTEVVLEALARLGAAPTFVLGGHFGALVATDLALRAPAVERLVLDGVPAWDAAERAARRAVNTPIAPLNADGEMVHSLWTRAFKVLTTADPEARLDAHSESAFLDAFRAFLALGHKPGPGDAFFDYPLLERLPALTQPALVIGSPTDTLRAYHERALAALRQGQGMLLDDVHPLYRVTRAQAGAAVDEYAARVHAFLIDGAP